MDEFDEITRSETDLRPLLPEDGYLPIADHALIGDGQGCALVGRDAAITWLCVPRFDSPPLVCGLLDADRGGVVSLLAQDVIEADQSYLPDTGVVKTTVRTATGLAVISDAFLLHPHARLEDDATPGRGELLRRVRVLSGRVSLRPRVELRGGARVSRSGGGWRLCPHSRDDVELHLSVDQPLDPDEVVELDAGGQADVVLRWAPGSARHERRDHAGVLRDTAEAWRRWAGLIRYDGPQRELVRRSALTLKLLDHLPNGAIIAAPTSSLPEEIGGEQPPTERVDTGLAGYRGSTPVRWGNAAAEQTQNDVYGEILDCAYQWAGSGGELDAHLWNRLAALTDTAWAKAREPDHGIWEVRSPGRPFTYSVALCQVALDRAARLVREHGLPGVVPADHPRMIAITRAVTDHLDAGDGLLYRYLPDRSPDGLAGHEGAFLLCSFWLVDNLAAQGELDRALELYESLCARAGKLGLLPEEIDPGSGAFLGNYPQAFSHVGVVSSGINLTRRLAARERGPKGGTR